MRNVDSELTICHKSSPPAENMYAVRLEDLTRDWWENQLTLTCLQGLVNRKAPHLYLVQDRYDDLWLEWLVERGDIETVTWISADNAIEQFLPAVEGMVIVDPTLAASFNVATMLAGIENCLVASPVVIQSHKLDQKVPADRVIDLRSRHWENGVEAYRWFYDRYYDMLSHRMVAMVDPYDIPLRDYLVAFRIPLVWLSSNYGLGEAELVEEILLKLPTNIPCLGWPVADCSPDVGVGEHMGVKLVSECAKFEVCSGYETVSRAVGNISVHSGTTAEPPRNQSLPLPPLDEDKVYVAFIRSDGDGPNFYRECYRDLWSDLHHGKFPVGWQLGPTCYDLIPDILDYYFKRATPNDSFVNALTGVGYVHEYNYAYMYPSEQREQIWEEYLQISERYRARLGLSSLTTYREMPARRLAAFCRIGFEAVFANYNRSPVTSLHNQIEQTVGVPVFRACNQWFPSRVSMKEVADDVRIWTPKTRPAFVFVSLNNWFTRMEYLGGLMRHLGPEYVAVSPDQLARLYLQSQE